MNPTTLYHPEEDKRLEALHQMAILDTKPEERFDALTREALERLHVPISTISILDEDREWFKSCQGLDMTEGPRNIAFCSFALLAKSMFIVPDTLKDDRFKNNPYVTGKPFVRFYAGMALLDYKSGLPIAVFCIKDTQPRNFSMEEVSILMELADRAEKELNTK